MREDRPDQIGRYQLLGELGRGGFGRVYHGYDPIIGRPVAVKILTNVSEDNLTRFRNEAVVAEKLGQWQPARAHSPIKDGPARRHKATASECKCPWAGIRPAGGFGQLTHTKPRSRVIVRD